MPTRPAVRAAAAATRLAHGLSGLNYDTIDPGVRGLVRLLREHGFDTNDSGDGHSKIAQGYDPEQMAHVPHVATGMLSADVAAAEAIRLHALLLPMVGPEVPMEVSLLLVDGDRFILLLVGVADADVDFEKA